MNVCTDFLSSSSLPPSSFGGSTPSSNCHHISILRPSKQYFLYKLLKSQGVINDDDFDQNGLADNLNKVVEKLEMETG